MNKVIDKDIYYPRFETSELLNIHVNTIANLEKRGILNGKRLGRRVFFKGSDLIDALEGSSPIQAT